MPPDVAVEVISPAEERADIKKKPALYGSAGVPLVWWVDPESRTVPVHRLGRKPTVLAETATLDGEKVLPGFTLPVGRVFAIKRKAGRD